MSLQIGCPISGDLKLFCSEGWGGWATLRFPCCLLPTTKSASHQPKPELQINQTNLYRSLNNQEAPNLKSIPKNVLLHRFFLLSSSPVTLSTNTHKNLKNGSIDLNITRDPHTKSCCSLCQLSSLGPETCWKPGVFSKLPSRGVSPRWPDS